MNTAPQQTGNQSKKLRDLIVERMAQLNMTWSEFAKYVGIANSTLNALLSKPTKLKNNPAVNPSVETLFKLEAALAIPVTTLIERLRPAPECEIDFEQFIGMHPMNQSAHDFVSELRDE